MHSRVIPLIKNIFASFLPDNITSIKDPTISLKCGFKLRKYLLEHKNAILKEEAPENICNLIKDKTVLLKLTDITWLNSFLQQKNESTDLLQGNELDDEIKNFLSDKNISDRTNPDTNIYLHEVLEGCDLVLPQNEVIKRNPVLEARIKKLQKEQEEREYKAMTKNVDMTKKFAVEDSLAYQSKFYVEKKTLQVQQ